MDHRQRATNPARFCQLDVDAVDASVQSRKIGRDERVFVDDDRNRNAFANRAQLVRPAGGNRLLAELDVVALEFAQNAYGRLRVPAFVGVDADRPGIPRADGGNRLDLFGRRAGPEFYLKDRMVAGFGELEERRVRIGDADRQRRDRSSRRIEAEQRIERLAELLAHEIVQSEIEPGARGGGNAVVQQRLETVRIVGGKRVGRKVIDDALDRLTVALDRRRLADPFAVAVANRHDRRVRDAFLTAGDLERMAQLQLDRRDGKGEHAQAAFNRSRRLTRPRARRLTGGDTLERLDCV